MSDPLVTLGVPVYRGEDTLPRLLDCLAAQTYRNIEVLISVDAADRATAAVCEPCLQRDARFRMHVQPARLGWAGNTDWTMRNRAGDFYIYQQHDDLLSPTYVADLVAASRRWPEAVLFFAKLRFTGTRDEERVSPSLLGAPVERALQHLRHLDWVPFRGLIRGSALEKTSGLLLSDFDPFDSLGTEHRFMLELALLGTFRFVEGPTYYKDWHEKNLSKKRESWTLEHWLEADACFAAWMIEALAPAGASVQERRRLFKIALDRFVGSEDDPLERLRPMLGAVYKMLPPVRKLADLLLRKESLRSAIQPALPAWELREMTPAQRADLLRQIYARLRSCGRFDPVACLGLDWDELRARYFTPSV